ncbi:MAG: helix-turn-helix transcriptional regulator [Anaerolineales bacterium]|nr:helix-turn-helix transcriptional regulator [Anaerolineales bacterium]
MEQTIGKRIAQLRQARGLTQQQLADRIAVSRVAVSHFEMDLALPSERTITLIAGIFKLRPHALVDGTTYPLAKMDRLPLAACCYTELEQSLALLYNDLAWLERLSKCDPHQEWGTAVRDKWLPQLASWQYACLDEAEQRLVDAARTALLAALHALH